MYYYAGGGGSSRGPFPLSTGIGAESSKKFDNILQFLQDNLDSGFIYESTVGAMMFYTPDSGKTIHISSRTYNGGFSKTFQALNLITANNTTNDPAAHVAVQYQ